MVHRHSVALAFERAEGYHQRADLQRRVARHLADMVGKFALPDQAKILEIGCGTGFLSQHLLKQWPNATFLFTDIAPAMISRCQNNLVGLDLERVGFAVMDGENLPNLGSFDLIVSSLAFQWFKDPLGNLEKLCQCLRPGGRLVFTTLGEETFHEWRALCSQHRIACGLHNHPDREAWEKSWPVTGCGQVVESRIVEEFASPLLFLKGLKRIGAALSAPDHQPVSGTRLRQVLRSFSRKNISFSATYHIFLGSFIKDGLDID